MSASVSRLVVLVLACTNPAYAAYRISTVVDSTGEFSSFGLPSINNTGAIVYRADYDDFAAGSVVIRDDGSGATPIASTAGPLLGFPADPGIDSDGTVALVADLDAGGRSVFSGYGGALTTVATTAVGGFSDISPHVSVGSGGTIAYTAFPVPPPTLPTRGVFRYYNGTTTLMATQLATVTNSGILEPAAYAADASFSWVWFQTVQDGAPSIWLATNPPFLFESPITGETVASRDFSDFELLSAGGTGDAIFRGVLLSGTRGIFRAHAIGDDDFPILIDDTGEFADFDQGFLMFRNAGLETVTLRAQTDSGVRGIYQRTLDLGHVPPTVQPVTEKILTVGDSLGGSTVADLSLGLRPQNASGTVVFWARLANGTSGVYSATPVSAGGGGGGGAIDLACALLLGMLALGRRAPVA